MMLITKALQSFLLIFGQILKLSAHHHRKFHHSIHKFFIITIFHHRLSWICLELLHCFHIFWICKQFLNLAVLFDSCHEVICHPLLLGLLQIVIHLHCLLYLLYLERVLLFCDFHLSYLLLLLFWTTIEKPFLKTTIFLLLFSLLNLNLHLLNFLLNFLQLLLLLLLILKMPYIRLGIIFFRSFSLRFLVIRNGLDVILEIIKRRALIIRHIWWYIQIKITKSINKKCNPKSISLTSCSHPKNKQHISSISSSRKNSQNITYQPTILQQYTQNVFISANSGGMRQLLAQRTIICLNLGLTNKKKKDSIDRQSLQIFFGQLFKDGPNKLVDYCWTILQINGTIFGFLASEDKFVPICKNCNQTIYVSLRGNQGRIVCGNKSCKVKLLGQFEIGAKNRIAKSKSFTQKKQSERTLRKSELLQEKYEQIKMNANDRMMIKKAAKKIVS